jgi:TPP-dependent pyruvate/acetoin dehydrogenase alpha subunit
MFVNNKNIKIRFYEKMIFIRIFEENLLKLFDEGVLFGTTHTSLGQESLAVALSETIESNDIIFSSHRCHGHYIASTGDAKSLLLEIMGRVGGICEGYGGSQHIHKGNFYSNGIQGGYVPIVAGMAYAEKIKKSNAIAIGIIGDGTMGEGNVYEGLNLMGILNTPSLIIIENNRYAQSTETSRTTSGTLIGRAKAFDINCSEIESNDVFVIYEELKKILKQVREEQRPFVFVHNSYRLGPHSKGDDNRTADEIESWKWKDPIPIIEESLTDEEIQVTRNRVCLQIEKITLESKSEKFAKLDIRKLLKGSLWKEDMFNL